MKRLIWFLVLAGLFFYLIMPTEGQSANQGTDISTSLVPVVAQDSDAKILKDRLDQLEAKFEQLKKENDKLKKDLELLKGELVNGKGVKGPGEDKTMNPKATYRGIDYELTKCTRNGATVKLTFLLLSPKTDANAIFGGLAAIDNEGAIYRTTMRAQIQPGGGIGGVRLTQGVKSKVEVLLNVPNDVAEFRMVEILAGSNVPLPKGETIRFKNIKITE